MFPQLKEVNVKVVNFDHSRGDHMNYPISSTGADEVSFCAVVEEFRIEHSILKIFFIWMNPCQPYYVNELNILL